MPDNSLVYKWMNCLTSNSIHFNFRMDLLSAPSALQCGLHKHATSSTPTFGFSCRRWWTLWSCWHKGLINHRQNLIYKLFNNNSRAISAKITTKRPWAF
jgi:hypothetical protein